MAEELTAGGGVRGGDRRGEGVRDGVHPGPGVAGRSPAAEGLAGGRHLRRGDRADGPPACARASSGWCSRSTSDYWRIWYYLAEAAGLEVWLVNARDVKHLPGRAKSDRADCVWLCKLNERGMLRRSFVPPRAVRDLRMLTRTRSRLAQDQARHQARVEKILEDALLKVSSVISDLFGVVGPPVPGRPGRRGAVPRGAGRPGRLPAEGQQGDAGGDADRPVPRHPRRARSRCTCG